MSTDSRLTDSADPEETLGDLPCQRGDNTCEYCEEISQVDPDGMDLLVGNHVQI